MSEIRSVQLELLRHGPAHNQLLSPLTPYLALCGGDGPVTIHMPFEQRELLNRLERLRYSTEGKEISGGQREAEVREMGEVARPCSWTGPGVIVRARQCPRGTRQAGAFSAFAFGVRTWPRTFRSSHRAGWFPGIGLSALSPVAAADLTHA